MAAGTARDRGRIKGDEFDMADVIDRPETDVRERILVTAERLFREIGYQKTTVADIAKSLHIARRTYTASSTPRNRSPRVSRAG